MQNTERKFHVRIDTGKQLTILPFRSLMLGSGGLQSSEAMVIIFLLWLHNFVRSPVFVSGDSTHGLLAT